MRCHLLALVLFSSGLLFVLATQVHGQIPSWVDNNPANAPRLYPCGACGAVPGCAAAPAAKSHRCALLDRLKSCRLACLARRCQRHAGLDCGAAGCGADACGCGPGCEGNGCGCGNGGGCGNGCGSPCEGCSDCGQHDHGHLHGGAYEAGENAPYEGPAPASALYQAKKARPARPIW
jgi:hypothetical protein